MSLHRIELTRATSDRQAERRATRSEAPKPHITAPDACRARMISEGRISAEPGPGSGCPIRYDDIGTRVQRD